MNNSNKFTQLNIEFKITNYDKNKYRMFRVSEFQEDEYEYVIKELFKKLPFHFDNIEYLNKQSRLCSMKLINTNKKYDPSKIQLVVAYYNEDLRFLDTVKNKYGLNNILLLSKKHTYHDKYREDYWKKLRLLNPLIGVWCTCFVAFLKHDKLINEFLQHWYKQTLMFTTQDQVGFSFSLQTFDICPLTLPNREINGQAHSKTDFFIKQKHENYETGS
jgi:hypothetical protein